jgi:hypothetical protein
MLKQIPILHILQLQDIFNKKPVCSTFMREVMGMRNNVYGIFSYVVVTIFIMLNQCGSNPSENNEITTAIPTLSIAFTKDTIEMGNTWSAPNVSVLYNNKDIASSVNQTGSVDCTKKGTYFVNFSITDSIGNAYTAQCTVSVILPRLTVLSLTFDSSITDNGPNNLIGTNHGATLTQDRFGNNNSAFHFNGAAYIQFDYTDVFDITDSFTIVTWARSDQNGADYSLDGFIVDCGYVADSGFGIRLIASTDKIIPYYSAAQYATLTNIPVLDTSWHNYVLRYDGKNLAFFIDGSEMITLEKSPGTIIKNPFRIGAQSKSLDRYWYGDIDDVLIVARPLSDASIKVLASAVN